MEPLHQDGIPGEAACVTVYLDDAQEPLAVFRPPAQTQIDTTALSDGEHVLRLRAVDESGVVGVRTIPFVVRNGPYISVSGIKAHETVGGHLDLRVNAFSSGEYFDPVAAESRSPTPSVVWVGLSIFLAWSLWYGLGSFFTPPAYANSRTFEKNALGAANAPMTTNDAAPAGATKTVAGGAKNVSGFNYSATGPALFATNCAGCHGAEGAGVPGAFPALAKDKVVNAEDATEQIKTVLHGLHGKQSTAKRTRAKCPPTRN